MTRETGGPAFPTENGRQVGPSAYHYEGMTLRDYFASQVLPGVVQVCANDVRQEDETRAQHFVRVAYELADAMLAERAKP